jgi:hypothetical protein
MLPTNEDSTAATAYARLNGEATSVLATARFARSALTAPIAVSRLLEFHARLRTAYQLFGQAKGNAALLTYTRNTLGNQTYDLDASLTAVQAAITNIGTWIEANVPQDGTGGVVTVRFGAGSTQAPMTMATAATAGLIPLIDALVSSITT